MNLSLSTIVRAAAGASLFAVATLGHAANTDFQLRALNLETVGAFQVTDTVGAFGNDRFNNGNPLFGISYQPLFNGTPNGAPQTTGYASDNVFSAGAELGGAATDFVGQQYGVGSLAFRRGDAVVSTSNLTPAGYDSYSVSLATATPPGTSLGLIGRSSGFDVETVWNFQSLNAGESIFLGLTGTPGGTTYTDRLQLRYGTSLGTGLPFLSFEQQTRDGSVFTRTTLGSANPATLVGNLASVDYIALRLHRDMTTASNPNPGVIASVELLDAAVDGTGDLVSLGGITFAAEGSTFLNASSQFQRVFTGGSWLQAAPVPEPGTWVLMALGMAGIGFTARRRLAAQG